MERLAGLPSSGVPLGSGQTGDGKRFPSDLSKSGAIKKTADGFTYLDPAQFHEYFAADLSAEQAAFKARSQVLNFAENFSATISTAAWRTKPSWMLVAGSDRTISPGLGTLVWQTGQEPHGRSRRRQPLSLHLASQGNRGCN
jgi:ABC-type phosphate transport system substrate-binding protein